MEITIARSPVALFGCLLLGAALAACSPVASDSGAPPSPSVAATASQPTSATEDPSRSLWGSWNATGICPDGGQERVQMLLSPNGSYSQVTECSGVNGPDTYSLRITGNYQVDASLSQIDLTNLQSDPAKDQNGNPYLHASTELDDYLLAGGNTLTISNRVCGSPCTITYRRS